MRELKNTSLICIDCYSPGRGLGAILLGLKHIKPQRAILLTDVAISHPDVEVVQIPSIKTIQEYSRFMVKELWKYFDTEFCITVQHDGLIIDEDAFDDRLFDVDYAGSPWLESDGMEVGNGGLSWRSHKLCKAVGTDENIKVTHPEDRAICTVYRPYLEKEYGLKWASVELAEGFSFELRAPAKPTFGHHSYFHERYKPTVVIKRNGAMGDVILTEPVLHYFHKKGCHVVLDTLPQFYNLFIPHYFKVQRPEEMDQRVLEKAKVYNLDLSYETNPHQNYLKSYFQFCEVPEDEMELRSPKLSLTFDPSGEQKIFERYIVLHLADRPQNGRNVQGNIDWEKIVHWINISGYIVIQIGLNEHKSIAGAISMKTPNEAFMKWVVGGADYFIGIDSGPAHIANSFGVPCALFFGSVDPNKVYPNLDNVYPIELKNKCDTPKCWHRVVGCEGLDCSVDEKVPPCVQFNQGDVIKILYKMVTSPQTKAP